MPRPGSGTGKFTISGKRPGEKIVIDVESGGQLGYTVDGAFKPLTLAQISAGVIVKANAGDDEVTGGRGDDELNGEAGNDTLNGGAGFDKLLGGVGNDTLMDDLMGAIFDGGRGYDTLDFTNASAGVGIYGSDVERGIRLEMTAEGLVVHHYEKGTANRVLDIEHYIGSGFSDVIWGDNFDDDIYGGAEGDYLSGMGLGADFDRVFGEAGNDVLGASPGVDWLTGGTGADQFHFSANQMYAGQDIVFDYSKLEGDAIVLQFAQSDVIWAPYSYAAPDDSLVGSYGSEGGTIVLVGVTSVAQVTTQVLAGYSVRDIYYFDPGL